jgi:hypothetical protein
MVTGHLAVRAAGLLISGVAGAAVVDRLKQPTTGAAVKRAAVAVTALTLRGKRRLETGAENLRLSAGDVVAEARERIGEQAPPPAQPAQPHDHDH